MHSVIARIVWLATLFTGAAPALPGHAAWPWDGQEVAVVSDVFEHAAYTRATRTLTLTFKNGGPYQYRDVPPGLYEDFLGAIHKGRFFNRHIRGRYKTRRLAPPPADAQHAETPPTTANPVACPRNESQTTTTPKKD